MSTKSSKVTKKPTKRKPQHKLPIAKGFSAVKRGTKRGTGSRNRKVKCTARTVGYWLMIKWDDIGKVYALCVDVGDKWISVFDMSSYRLCKIDPDQVVEILSRITVTGSCC